MTLGRIAELSRKRGLAVLGAFHPNPKDPVPPGAGTVVMLGPEGQAFWDRFVNSSEYQDGRPDPVDRWSTREIGALADALEGTALFPFGGPPWLPFIDWAKRSGAWSSPVGLLVHEKYGLFVSYRGALVLPGVLDLPSVGPRPCDSCAGPCLTACPAAALTAGGYDTDACHAWLNRVEGHDCMSRGCAVRRSCPVGQYERGEAQSAFHMAAFHANHAT